MSAEHLGTYFVPDAPPADNGSMHGDLMIDGNHACTGTINTFRSLDDAFGGRPWRVEYVSTLTPGMNVLPMFMPYTKNDGSKCTDFAYFQRICSNDAVQIVRACIECGHMPDAKKNEPHSKHPDRDKYPILGQSVWAWHAEDVLHFIQCNELAVGVHMHEFRRLITCADMPRRVLPSFQRIVSADQFHHAVEYLMHWNDAIEQIKAPTGVKKALKYGLVEIQNFGSWWALDALLEIDFDADQYAEQIGRALSDRISKPAPDGCIVVGLHRVECEQPFTKGATYRDYLGSQRWSDRKRRERVRLTGSPDGELRCENPECVSGTGPFDLHHHTYSRVGHEFSGDLAFLCRGCHSAFESIKRMAPAA